MAGPVESRNAFHCLLMGSILLGACGPKGEASRETSGHLVWDSAGVTIVESSAPAWGEGENWALSEEPLLSIGAVDGPEEYLLYQSISAMRLDDGRIVFANNGSQELRFYDPQGTFLHASGAEGEGPGEFRSIGYIWRLGRDSLAVLDFGLFRISVFDRNGEFGRVLRLEGEGTGMVFPGGLFEDGSVLGLATLQDTGENPDLGAFRDLLQHRQYDRDGRFVENLVTLFGSELFRAALPDGSVISTGRRHGLTALTTTGTDSWFYGSSASYEVQEWSIYGDLLKVFRLTKERRPTPQQVLDEWEENVRGMNSQRRQLWEAVPVAEHLPAYEQILLDRAGNLWTAEYLVLDETPIWQVFGPDGRWLGSVSMPPGGRVSEIGEDYVIGTWKDEMDVETVRMYGLVKPGSP